MKKDAIHKVNMRVKGNLRHLTYKLRALIKATRLGLKTNRLIQHYPGNIEMEFEGDRAKLWKIVKWSKGNKFFCVVDEVMFTFSPVETLKA